jgi:G:T-mismatch repair DNA endonuclease (very short patch repair protein)
LHQMGWRVLIVWECGLRKRQAETLGRLLNAIKNPGVTYEEIPSPDLRDATNDNNSR